MTELCHDDGQLATMMYLVSNGPHQNLPQRKMPRYFGKGYRDGLVHIPVVKLSNEFDDFLAQLEPFLTEVDKFSDRLYGGWIERLALAKVKIYTLTTVHVFQKLKYCAVTRTGLACQIFGAECGGSFQHHLVRL
jgi:hypothetical protein